MKRQSLLLLLFAFLFAFSVRAQTNEDFTARYQVILDRIPFGIVPPSKMGQGALGFGRYAFVGLVSPDGMSDNSNRVAVIHDRLTSHYYFKAEGEQIEDVKVLRVENAPTGRKLLLQRGGDIMTLTYAQPVTPDGVAPPNPFGRVKTADPFGPAPQVVTTIIPSAVDKQALRDQKEAAKRTNDNSKRNNNPPDRKKEKPTKVPAKR
ncbi:MAG: hypothetical protein FJ395_11105 [Verrucomicrobia bacterium]|nr:hypothetical protein [Verrucomicrobiota bacterium]